MIGRVSVVVQILLVAVQNDRNAPAGEQQGKRLVEAVLIIVNAQQPWNIVAVEKSHQVVGRRKVVVFLGDGVVDFVEVAVVRKDIPHRGRQGKIEQRHSAMVGKLVRIEVQRICGSALKPLSE